MGHEAHETFIWTCSGSYFVTSSGDHWRGVGAVKTVILLRTSLKNRFLGDFAKERYRGGSGGQRRGAAWSDVEPGKVVQKARSEHLTLLNLLRRREASPEEPKNTPQRAGDSTMADVSGTNIYVSRTCHNSGSRSPSDTLTSALDRTFRA